MVSWPVSTMRHLVKPLVGGALLLSLLTFPFPEISSTQRAAEAAPPTQVPPGQLTRRSLSGRVVSKSSSAITVGTRFGNVSVKRHRRDSS